MTQEKTKEKIAQEILDLKKRIGEKAGALQALAVEGKITEMADFSKEIAILQNRKITLENEGLTDSLQGMLASFRDLQANFLAKKLDLASYWQLSERICQTGGQSYKYQLRVTRSVAR